MSRRGRGKTHPSADQAKRRPDPAATPEAGPKPGADALDGNGAGSSARALWPELEISDLLVTPLTAGGERLGLLCAGSRPGRKFSSEDTELARAI